MDISEVVIARMRHKYSMYEKMTWDAGDVTDLKYPEGTFDLAFDKGTLDALISDKKGPWDYGPEVQQRLQGYISSINRILATKGIWIIISFEQPHFLRRELQSD